MRESSRRVIARLRAPLAPMPEPLGEQDSPPVRIRRTDPPDFQAAYQRVSSELAQQRLAIERRNRELAGLLESTFSSPPSSTSGASWRRCSRRRDACSAPTA